ncbi:type II toxin-antitoxin system RelE/ParE family toxin [Agrobacterium tumefaciens]|uniref:type II toxin-antitoxin system RelE/ParE family toxin n=1 Tax=Agrobacterium tumefaciens TaxID=358 RepID=UPI001F34AD3C
MVRKDRGACRVEGNDCRDPDGAGQSLSNVKSVGSGVLEYRIDYGPGYRVYFGRDGDELVILLIGGTKARQQNDIEAAKAFWQDYKSRKGARKGAGTGE